MKYFLFISLRCGTCHNELYSSLAAVRKSVEQLVDEEELDKQFEDIPSEEDLKKHFCLNDVFTGYLSNETWFRIQETSDENILNTFGTETIPY